METETSHSMQHLLELDTIKTRMMDSQNALQVHLYTSSSSSSSLSSYSFFFYQLLRRQITGPHYRLMLMRCLHLGTLIRSAVSMVIMHLITCVCLQISDKLIRMQQSLVRHTLSHSNPPLDSFVSLFLSRMFSMMCPTMRRDAGCWRH